MLGGGEGVEREDGLNGYVYSMSRNLIIGMCFGRINTDEAGCSRSLVNARNLQLECAKVLYESLLVLFLTYGSETMIWMEKERSREREREE